VVVLVGQRRAAAAYDPAAIGQDRGGTGEGSEMGEEGLIEKIWLGTREEEQEDFSGEVEAMMR